MPLVGLPVVGVLGVGPGATLNNVGQHPGTGHDPVLPLLQGLRVCLEDLGGRYRRHVPGDEPHELDVTGGETGLRRQHHRPLVGQLHTVYRYGGGTAIIGVLLGVANPQAHMALERELDISASKLAAVHRRLVVPVDALADVPGKGLAVRRQLPALRQRPLRVGQRYVVVAKVIDLRVDSPVS